MKIEKYRRLDPGNGKITVAVKMALFFTVIFFFFIISLIIPLRPEYSPLEKRQLQEFPTASVGTVLSGEYFRGIEGWFSDTFPFRDTFVSINFWVKSFYGVNETTVYGTVVSGDDIPEGPLEK